MAPAQVLPGPVAARQQLGVVGGARVLGPPAPGVEPAAGRRIGRGGYVAVQDDLLTLATHLGVGHRHRRHERLGVRVDRALVDLVLVAHLHDPPQVHHGHPVGDVAHHRQVVGDEDVRQPEVLLQVLQQVDHLGLHRDVQGRDGLVTHDDLGAERNTAGNPDTLTLATGELVGVTIDVLGVEPHQVEQLLDPFAALVAWHDVGVDEERLTDDVTDRLAWIQRGVRVLEDDLDVAAQLAHLRTLGVGDVLAVEDDASLGGLLQGDEQPSQGGLSTPGLTDHTQGFTGVEVEAHPVHRLDAADRVLDDAGLERVVLLEVTNRQDGFAGRLGGFAGFRLAHGAPPRCGDRR